MSEFVQPSLLVPPVRRDLSARAVETLFARSSGLDLSALLVYDFDQVDATALPVLAEQFNVLGDAGWAYAGMGPNAEPKRRALLKSAIALHRTRGTRYAVQRALDAVGINSTVTEWHQTIPAGQPYTFSIGIYLTDTQAGQPVLTPERVDAVLRMIRFWKPARSAFSVRVGVGMTASKRSAAVLRAAQSVRVSARPGPTSMSADCRTRTACVLRMAQRASLTFFTQGVNS